MRKIILSCFLLLSIQSAIALSYTLELSEAEIQQKVSAMMPIEAKKSLFTIILSNATVSLIKESGEVAVASSLDVVIPGGLKVPGRVKIRGSLSYDAARGEFFLANAKVDEFEAKGLPEKYKSNVKELIQHGVATYLAQHPVYKLKDDNTKQRLAKYLLRSVSVKGDRLLLVLGP